MNAGTAADPTQPAEPVVAVDYLAIAPRSFLDALAPLLGHRRGEGLEVRALVAEDVFARRSAGELSAVALRDEIRAWSERSNGRLRYVLLVGDVPRPDESAEGKLPTFHLEKLAYDTHDHERLHYRHRSLLHVHDDDCLYPTDHPFAVLGETPPNALHLPHGEATAGGSHGSGSGIRPAAGSAADATVGEAQTAAARWVPDLAVGRLPARDAEEVRGFVAKLLAHEQRPLAGPWSRRLVVFAGPARFGPVLDGLLEATAVQLLDQQISYDYDLSFVFSKPGSPYAYRFDEVADKLVSEANQGAQLLLYVGHSSPAYFDSVEYRGRWYSLGARSDFERMTITAGRPLFVALSCGVGAFDMSRGRRSIAEEAALNPTGPIAAFAASRESHPYPNMLYGEALAEELLDRRPARLGDAIVAVKRNLASRSHPIGEMLTNVSTDALRHEHLGLYNLMGDPATHLLFPATARMTAMGGDAGGRGQAHLESPVVDGDARLSVETRRSALPEGGGPGVDLDRLPVQTALERMAAAHALATDKTVTSWTVRVVDGRALTEVQLPEEPGTYVVRALVTGLDRSGRSAVAAGHARIEVTGSPLPRARPRR